MLVIHEERMKTAKCNPSRINETANSFVVLLLFPVLSNVWNPAIVKTSDNDKVIIALRKTQR